MSEDKSKNKEKQERASHLFVSVHWNNWRTLYFVYLYMCGCLRHWPAASFLNFIHSLLPEPTLSTSSNNKSFPLKADVGEDAPL